MCVYSGRSRACPGTVSAVRLFYDNGTGVFYIRSLVHTVALTECSVCQVGMYCSSIEFVCVRCCLCERAFIKQTAGLRN